jgi:glycosyltransferase involved in cell wall biosynthesis
MAITRVHDLGAKLRWGLERARLGRQQKSLAGLARALGFPTPPSSHRRPDQRLLDPPASQPVPLEDRAGTCAATVCTRSHLAFARTLASSLRRQQPDLELFVLVLDADPSDPVVIPDATVLLPPQIGMDDRYLFLKLTATEACCAAKPFLVAHLLEHTPFRQLVYLDADIWVLAPMTALLDALSTADFVVLPHLMSPLPGAERSWERPCLGDVAGAGVLNAGLFGTRASAKAIAFVEQWRELVSGPWAFSYLRGLQHEQHHFNWVTAFVERVTILRDPAYNVAYWNLHERSLRTAAAGGSYTIEGQPLVAFHFSGFSLHEPHRLSCHESRHSPLLHGPLARLLEDYAHELIHHGALQDPPAPYRFDRFPSGIAIDTRMRSLFRDHELQLRAPFDPWTEEGERFYCRALLASLPGLGSLLPPLVLSVYRDRPDLQASFPRAALDPAPMLAWFGAEGVREYCYGELFGLHRPSIPSGEGLERLARERELRPRCFAGLAAPLGRDRSTLIARLEAAGSDEVDAVKTLRHERYALSPIWLVRELVRSQPDLRATYPDLLLSGARDFAAWLAACGTRTHLLPADTAERFLRAAEGRALARIYSFVSRTWGLMELWPLAFVGEGHAALAEYLLRLIADNLELDLDDVVMFEWLMEEAPWAGLALTLELPLNACAEPSPLLPEGQERLLAPVLGKDPRFRQALMDLRAARSLHSDPLVPTRIRRLGRAPNALTALRDPRLNGRNGHGQAPTALGVNFFGFFKSPVGLGYLSRGLAQALTTAGVGVRERLLTNLAMDEDLRPEDFLVPYEHAFDTNLFASYPHLHERLLELQPTHVTRGRRNVIYLAWEQREANPCWREVYEPFDQVWALSRFAAEALAAALGRAVVAIPCPLDVAAMPPAATKGEAGVDDDRFAVLYVCDANSSLERKNPEAAIAAFAAAMRHNDRATMLLRIANAHRREHGPRLARLARQAAATGLDVRLITKPLSRRGILRLISAVDCYLSLHRAEGFGFTCAEAMAYGRPTIATGYSGNLDFMDETCSYLVDSREVEVAVPEGPFQRGSLWADPSVEHAAHLLRRVFDAPQAAAEVGARGARRVRDLLAPERIGRIAAAALAGIPASTLHDSARGARSTFPCSLREEELVADAQWHGP